MPNSLFSCLRKPKRREIEFEDTFGLEHWQRIALTFIFTPGPTSRALDVPFRQLGFKSVTDFIKGIPIPMSKPFETPTPVPVFTKHDIVVWVAPNGTTVERAAFRSFKYNKHRQPIRAKIALERESKCFESNKIAVPIEDIVHYKEFLRRYLPRESLNSKNIIVVKSSQEAQPKTKANRRNMDRNNRTENAGYQVGNVVINKNTREYAIIEDFDCNFDDEDPKVRFYFAAVTGNGTEVNRTNRGGQATLLDFIVNWEPVNNFPGTSQSSREVKIVEDMEICEAGTRIDSNAGGNHNTAVGNRSSFENGQMGVENMNNPEVQESSSRYEKMPTDIQDFMDGSRSSGSLKMKSKERQETVPYSKDKSKRSSLKKTGETDDEKRISKKIKKELIVELGIPKGTEDEKRYENTEDNRRDSVKVVTDRITNKGQYDPWQTKKYDNAEPETQNVDSNAVSNKNEVALVKHKSIENNSLKSSKSLSNRKYPEDQQISHVTHKHAEKPPEMLERNDEEEKPKSTPKNKSLSGEISLKNNPQKLANIHQSLKSNIPVPEHRKFTTPIFGENKYLSIGTERRTAHDRSPATRENALKSMKQSEDKTCDHENRTRDNKSSVIQENYMKLRTKSEEDDNKKNAIQTRDSKSVVTQENSMTSRTKYKELNKSSESRARDEKSSIHQGTSTKSVTKFEDKLDYTEKHEKDSINSGKLKYSQYHTTSPKKTFSFPRSLEIEKLCGPQKGIQGKNNSCYLDATIFSMYYCTDIFDKITLEENDDDDLETRNMKAILRDDIVRPLVQNNFCSAENIKELRNALAPLNKKIQGSFMDAEELIFLLLEDTLKLKQFIRYSTGTEDFMHQIVPDPSDRQKCQSVQRLFQNSLAYLGNMKLADVPNPALILEMPRSDGNLVQYEAIIPSLSLDLSCVMEGAYNVTGGKRTCTCGVEATIECANCKIENGNDAVFYCEHCTAYAETFHGSGHIPNLVEISQLSQVMHLMAVICIRSKHYVAFVRNGFDVNSPWLFFDSMAGAYPEVRPVENMGRILEVLQTSPATYRKIMRHNHDVRRILTDSHICIYHSPTVSSRN